jgi:hypothetical protein
LRQPVSSAWCSLYTDGAQGSDYNLGDDGIVVTNAQGRIVT